MKKLLVGALALLALTACNQDNKKMCIRDSPKRSRPSSRNEKKLRISLAFDL